MPGHKLTLQAMWRLFVPKLLAFIKNAVQELAHQIQDELSNDGTDGLIKLFDSPSFKKAMDASVTSNDNPNFQYWWTYNRMVHILLLFTRAHREGLWQLYRHTFQQMLPFFKWDNHHNYAKWGTVYLSEMHKLQEGVKAEFERGNFVVKRSPQPFNQVDSDQSQEWLNNTGKKGAASIVGITKTTSLSRWDLSYSLRSHISSETKHAYGIQRVQPSKTKA